LSIKEVFFISTFFITFITFLLLQKFDDIIFISRYSLI